MIFRVILKDYESGQESDIHASEIEEAIQEVLNDRGDDGICEVQVSS